MPETRKLAAILAADVVGYSKLAGADEERTLARLRALRSDLIDPTIALHHGRVVKRTGDGVLIEFRSVVDAVRCAIEMQNGMVERNAGLPPERRIEIRIGIHLGDVVEESDGDLMGDGVNIAARLEGIAKPGAICLSEDAYRQVRSRLDLAVRDLGSTQLKNIAKPVHVFSVDVGEPTTTMKPIKSTARAAWLRTTSRPWAAALLIALTAIGIVAWQVAGRLGPPSRDSRSLSLEAQRRGPAIAVLPFDNLSGDPSQDFFSDGISEQLITALSHFDNLRVLARNTTFAYKKKATDAQELGRQLNVQYVIEGSFRRVADQISVTAQFIDARTGTHVWAKTFERPTVSASLLAIQDDVAQRISAAVGDMRMGAVTKTEFERTRGKPANELSSYECSLVAKQAGGLLQSAELVQRARTCLETTTVRDPTYAEAWADLVNVLFDQHKSGMGLPSPEAQDIDRRAYLVPRMMDAAKRADGLAEEERRELAALAEEKGSAFFRTSGTIIAGLVMAHTGEMENAAQNIKGALSALRSIGTTGFIPVYLSYLAWCSAELDRFEDAWSCIEHALTAAESSKQRWWQAETNRIAGEVVLRSPSSDEEKAQAYFKRALSIAREQQTKSWELRAAMSMARLWRDRGRRNEACDLLAPIYGWFTEGFNTRDLKEAKALLDEITC